MDFLEKLEAFKQKGVYSVNVSYGEGTGCDDSDVPARDRFLRVVGDPVGYLGSLRVMYVGTVKDFMAMDIDDVTPVQISNPPLREEYQDGGFFYWGSDESLKQVERQDKVFMM